MKRMRTGLLLLLFCATANAQSGGARVATWLSQQVLRNHVGCETPPYRNSEGESLEALRADLMKIESARKVNHCAEAEKRYEITYRLKDEARSTPEGMTSAIASASDTVHAFYENEDFDNAIARSFEFLAAFGFSDTDVRSEALRFELAQATNARVHRTGPDQDNNMTEAALDYHPVSGTMAVPAAYRYFSYAKFLNDFPESVHTKAVEAMLDFALDAEVERQMNIAETYEKISPTGTASARDRLIGIYAIPNVERSSRLPEVICRNAEEDVAIIRQLQALQAKKAHLSGSDWERLDQSLDQWTSHFHLLFEDGARDPERIVDFLKQEELPKLQRLMRKVTQGADWLQELHSITG